MTRTTTTKEIIIKDSINYQSSIIHVLLFSTTIFEHFTDLRDVQANDILLFYFCVVFFLSQYENLFSGLSLIRHRFSSLICVLKNQISVSYEYFYQYVQCTLYTLKNIQMLKKCENSNN